MKIRKSFVSNSSTTSFIIYGVVFGEEVTEDLESIAAELELEYHVGQEGYNRYIGRSYDSIKDDETGKQFKESIEKKLKERFGEDINVSHHEEAWYDG